MSLNEKHDYKMRLYKKALESELVTTRGGTPANPRRVPLEPWFSTYLEGMIKGYELREQEINIVKQVR